MEHNVTLISQDIDVHKSIYQADLDLSQINTFYFLWLCSKVILGLPLSQGTTRPITKGH